MTDATKPTIDEILDELAHSAWSLGLQGAGEEYLNKKPNNRFTVDEAKAALSALIDDKEDEAWDAGYEAGRSGLPKEDK